MGLAWSGLPTGFGVAVPAHIVAVPEPGSALLLFTALGIAFALANLKRHGRHCLAKTAHQNAVKNPPTQAV